MKKFLIITLILMAVLLSGCNLPGSQGETPEDADDQMATEIARILTGTPVEVDLSPTPQEEEEEETSIPAEPTATQEIEETEETVEPEETATIEPTETETPEAEDTATPTPTNTPTEEPTPTLAETDPARTLGEPDWVDTMEDGDNWPTGLNEFSSIKFEDGFLKLTGETELDGWRLSWPYLEDFYLEVSMQSPECEGEDHFGVMFRSPVKSDANKGYLFGITCDGQYSLRRWDGTTMFYPIQWTESDAINTGAEVNNKLGVMAEGENITLYINSEEVDKVVNPVYLTGNFGIFVGSVETEELTVWVDQVRYWENP